MLSSYINRFVNSIGLSLYFTLISTTKPLSKRKYSLFHPHFKIKPKFPWVQEVTARFMETPCTKINTWRQNQSAVEQGHSWTFIGLSEFCRPDRAALDWTWPHFHIISWLGVSMRLCLSDEKGSEWIHRRGQPSYCQALSKYLLSLSHGKSRGLARTWDIAFHSDKLITCRDNTGELLSWRSHRMKIWIYLGKTGQS